MSPNFSRIDTTFNQHTFFAAFPIAETIEIGVEITNAQGHPTTRTANP